MKVTYRELVAQSFCCLVPQCHEFESTHHIRQCLPGHDDVAIDFRFDLELAHRNMRRHPVNRLLSRPSKGVKPSIDNEPRRAPRVRAEHAEARHVAAIQTHLIG